MDQIDYFNKVQELHNSIIDAQAVKTVLWVDNVLFSLHWWVGLILSIIPWVVWSRISKKSIRDRMLYTGFLVLIISSFFDFLGVQFGLWLYYYEVFPWLPAYLPWDWTLMPVVIISLIEFKPYVSPILKGLIFSLITSFIGGPIFVFFNFYENINWEYYYSFPIYFLIYIIADWHSKRNNFDTYY